MTRREAQVGQEDHRTSGRIRRLLKRLSDDSASKEGAHGGTRGPPVEASEAKPDRELVARQLGRPPRAFGRVVVRCPFGRPAVTEQSPYDPTGEPFPTTYWVTCRYLVAAISRLEAAGGVERWSEEAKRDPVLAESLTRATEEQRLVRSELADGKTGRDDGSSLALRIGGSANPGQLKCLHAHVAFALARPGYELGERIVAEVEPPWPEKCCLDGEPMIESE